MFKQNGRIAIIGAGPAGLTAGYLLSKKGYAVDVFEADKQVGGMCKTIELWGCKVDIGPHRFFSNDKRVNELWLEIIGNDYEMVNRLTRIFYKSKYFDYPLKPINAFVNLGPQETLKCLVSYAKQRLKKEEGKQDFESWVVSRFGYRLYSIFFKTYSEKLWGIPCIELDADFAAQRIKKLSLYEAIKNAFLGGGGHKTLVDEFAYPTEGTGLVYTKMADLIQLQGGIIATSCPVKKVIVEGEKVTGIELSSGESKDYDKVISTMPLTSMVRTIDNVPENIQRNISQLKFRNTIIVYLNIAGKNLFPDNWLYIHSNNLQTGRITNFRNWVPQLYGNSPNSILALEFWCYNEDSIWTKSDEELIHLAIQDIKKTGLAGSYPILEGAVYRIPKCYPVYKRGYKENLKPVQDWLDTIKDLFAIGRYGSFKYNNQDHSILMGIMIAENIITDQQHKLWEVNTDYDSYQESTVITKTGLVKQSA